MSSQIITSTASFEDALTPKSLKTTRFIQFALMAGALLYAFAIIKIFFYNQGTKPSSDDTDSVFTLTITHFIFFGIALMVSRMLSNRIFSPARLSKFSLASDSGAVAQACVTLQRTAIVSRLAALEGASFMGLAACIVGATNGVLDSEPKYWVNMASTIFLVLFGIMTFPTKENLTAWFERKFVQSPS